MNENAKQLHRKKGLAMRSPNIHISEIPAIYLLLF